jgi:hypothetical protein
MADPLESLLSRAEADPFFLACILTSYARGRNLGEEDLARALGCPTNLLVDLRLCRSPRAEPAFFREDLGRIATRFGLDPCRLAEVVRRGQSLLVLRQRPPLAACPLLAAREQERGKSDP